MKMRPYYEQQIGMLSQYVVQQKEVEDEKTGLMKSMQVTDVGLLCGILSVELLLDIRDLMINVAVKEGAVEAATEHGLYVPGK